MMLIASLGTPLGVWAQPEVTQVGAGSYAAYPPAHEGDGPADMISRQIYITAPTDRAVPTNDWWTDLVASQYAGAMWAHPLTVSADANGLNVYFPTAFNDAGTAMELNAPLRIGGVVPPSPAPDDIVLADFEGGAYPAGWTTTGTAFGAAPALGGFPGQSAVSGYLGEGLVNSFLPGDGTTGTLTSAPFVINRDYLHFLIAGGAHPGETEVRLIVEGAIARSATGDNSETLEWTTWDLSDSAMQGATARLEIIDSATGGWGHICADQFFLSNDLEDPGDKYNTDFSPADARARAWSDWLVRFQMAESPDQLMDVTLGHGFPYVWVEFTGVSPTIRTGEGARYFDASGDVSFPYVSDHLGVEYAGRCYGVFAPDGTTFRRSSDMLTAEFGGMDAYIAVAAMPTEGDLPTLHAHAYAIPRATRLDYALDMSAGVVNTQWTITAEALKGANSTVLQGWIPHHYRSTAHDLAFNGLAYRTPRGVLRCAAGNVFNIAYPFHGLLPTLPAPEVLGTGAHDFDPERMAIYLAMYATNDSYGADTYWGGKDLVRYARYMGFAEQLDDPARAPLQDTLRAALMDWFTYVPGEIERYFAAYPNWGALVGFNESYYSFEFTDHHFHYGYFTTAAALLAMSDPAFLEAYGPMARLVAKEYANWERDDAQLPWLRTFDVWNGHSYAGGLSSPGGNNQESSSEAMQSWGGLFLLGTMLGDESMVATGAMGHAMEAAAIREYWLDYERYLNGPAAGNFSPSYDETITGILFDSGQAYATYFSGDPAWIYGIQWLPISPFLNYLVKDPAFAEYQFDSMMAERDANPDIAENTISQMGGSLGNVILGYVQLFDPDWVAARMDALWDAGDPVATDNYTGGITYYFTHANRLLGEIQWDMHIDVPTSQVYYNADRDEHSYVVYNPSYEYILADVYRDDARIGFVLAAPRKLSRATELLEARDAFEVLHTAPHEGDVDVAADTDEVAVVFSRAVVAESLAEVNISGPGVAGLTLATAPDGLLAVIQIEGALAAGETYLVTIPATASAEQDGATLSEAYTFTFSVAEAATPEEGAFLQAHYRLDETTGTIVVDAANGRDGTYLSAPALGAPGADPGTQTAVDFDGADDYAELVSTLQLGLLGNFTVTAWVNLDDTSGDHAVLGTDAYAPGKGLMLGVRDGKAHMGFYANDTTGAQTLDPGQWHHLAFRYRDGEQALYVDGVLDRADDGHNQFGGFGTVLIGRWAGDSGAPRMLDGRIDDVQVYRRALTDLEIAELHAAPGTINTNGMQNFAPKVDAGASQSVQLGQSVQLSGWVEDDGLPDPPAAVSVYWSVVAGPAGGAFADETALVTEVQLAAAGTYRLRLTADDGALTAHDEVTVSVTTGADLVAFYQLDELSGVTTTDSSGNGVHGAYVGAPQLGIPGAAEGTATAVGFNGTSQEVSLGASAVFNELVNDFTIACWVRPDVLGGNRIIFGANWEDYNGWSLRLVNDAVAIERLGPTHLYNAGATVASGVWTHVVAAYDADNDVHFYINGAPAGTAEGNDPASIATRPWFLASNGTGEKFDGVMDDLQVYRRALGPEEIAYLYGHPGATIGGGPLPGDVDGDGDVDLDDLTRLINCLAGVNVGDLPPGCTAAEALLCDLDGDGDIDLRDFAKFQAIYLPR